MKTMMKKVLRDESGKILILVLVLLVVGGLLLTPLLGLMSTGLVAGQVYEKKASELYAADAGVEDAIWRIQNSPPASYPYTYPAPLSVNTRDVEVTIDREFVRRVGCHKEYRYYILSEASADGSGTEVNAVLSVSYLSLNFSGLLDYAVASNHTIHLRGDGDAASEIFGDVYIWDKGQYTGNEDSIKSPWRLYDRHQRSVEWPTSEQLSDYYLKQVDTDNDRYYSDSIDVKLTSVIGSLYREGDLDIKNSGGKGTLTISSNSTVYIKGNLAFKQPGGPNSAYTINLNGQTVFVDGNIDMAAHFVSITGSGCIIATGDIKLLPSVSSKEGNYVLLLSLQGSVHYLPQTPGTPWSEPGFYGTIAASNGVLLNPNQRVHWVAWNDKNLNFPWGQDDETESTKGLPIDDLSIESWQILQGGQ